MKVIPPYLTFKQALTNGYVERMESPVYMRWVKTLRCVSCNTPADDPHHPHGAAFKGMGTKVSGLVGDTYLSDMSRCTSS